MNTKPTSVTFNPIGIIRSDLKKRTNARLELKKITAEIIIDTRYKDALHGLTGFSHIIVLFWMHLSNFDKSRLKAHPMGRKEAPVQGIFSLRTPNRPNAIGKSTVKLLEIKDNILRVQGLDAIDGTPVLDIKPYIPGYDSPSKSKVPDWIIIDK